MVKLPDVGEGVAEAEIVAWHVAVGDTIGEDDPFVDVMTDKATVELPSPVAGRITWLGADVGDIIAVGAELIAIDVDGGADTTTPGPTETAEPSAAAEHGEPSETAEPPEPAEAAAPTAPAAEPARGAAKALAAPAVRQRARELGVDLAAVAGTGPEGRIGHGDLDGHLISRRPGATGGHQDAPTGRADDSVEEVKITGLRRNIAQRIHISASRIPHFTYVEEVDVTAVERLRSELNEHKADDDRPKLTLLPFLMRAVVVAVAEHPQMNARFDDEAGVVRRDRAVHLGIAVQTPKGLMVPVVEHAERRDLWSNAEEVTRLSEAARSSKVTLAELSGSTITITSLGALGGLVTTPIINHPEVAIIGVNRIVQQPVYIDGTWVPRPTMNLSSSFDHRIIDGWDAALFIQRIKTLIESPAQLFI